MSRPFTTCRTCCTNPPARHDQVAIPMSMPFVEYSCTDCDFGSADHVIWGRFHYRTSKGEVDLERTLGWCDSCATLAPIEVLPSDDSLAKSLVQIEECKQQLDAISKLESASRPLWIRLLGLSDWSYDRMDLQRQLNDLKQGHVDLKARTLLLRDRRSGRRCLVCSSESVRQIPRPAMPGESEFSALYEQIHVGMQHPGCTGQLVAADSGTRIRMHLFKRVYDLEGHLLETVDCD